MGRFGLVIPPPLLCFTSRSIDFSSAEETAHILRVLLAILGGNDDLIFRRRLAFGSVWVSFEEDLYFGRAFTHFRNRSDLRVADRLSRRLALPSLRFGGSFGCCLVVDWEKVSYGAHWDKSSWIKLTRALQGLLCYASDVQPFAATGTRALYYQFIGVLRRFVDTYLS